MPKVVIKKSGEKEEFKEEKIKRSLISALLASKVNEKEAEKITQTILKNLIEFFAKRKEIYSAEIEAKIILELEKLAPQTIPGWRNHRIKKST